MSNSASIFGGDIPAIITLGILKVANRSNTPRGCGFAACLVLRCCDVLGLRPEESMEAEEGCVPGIRCGLPADILL